MQLIYFISKYQLDYKLNESAFTVSNKCSDAFFHKECFITPLWKLKFNKTESVQLTNGFIDQDIANQDSLKPIGSFETISSVGQFKHNCPHFLKAFGFIFLVHDSCLP